MRRRKGWMVIGVGWADKREGVREKTREGEKNSQCTKKRERKANEK